MAKILIIDGNNHCHRAYHKFQGLSYKGISTSITYGMPLIIESLIRKLKPDDVYLVWDGGKSPYRLEVYPEYKAGRKRTGDFNDFYRQRDLVLDMFNCLGLKQVYNRNIEADDYICMLASKFKKQKHEIVIASNDKDFNQLIGSRISVWNEIRKILINKKNLRKLYGYTPEQCVDYLCIGGDKSDNIKGVRGYGEGSKSLTEFFEKYGSVDNYLKACIQGDKHRNLNLELLKATYNRNKMVVDLKLFNRIHKLNPIYYKSKKPKFKPNRFIRLCKAYGIHSFTKPSFHKTFKDIR